MAEFDSHNSVHRGVVILFALEAHVYQPCLRMVSGHKTRHTSRRSPALPSPRCFSAFSFATIEYPSFPPK